jgi:hypothetical protein
MTRSHRITEAPAQLTVIGSLKHKHRDTATAPSRAYGVRSVSA